MRTASIPPSRDLQHNVTRVVQALLGINGMNQLDLVTLTGMAQPTLSGKMLGRSRWSLDDIERLAHVFKVDPRLFLTDPREVFGDALRSASLTQPYVAPFGRRRHLVAV
jgi:transcriptional regulator with XRE-family HTH domain